MIGVLALQGAFEAHASMLASLGHDVVEVRDATALGYLDGLVLPGGESGVQLRLIERLGMWEALVELHARGVPILATCAGLILVARGVREPPQRSFGFVDIDVKRNGYGRQLDSFAARSDDGALSLVFIRAPRIVRVGCEVAVMARHRGEPVLVQQGSVVAACFHPELTAHADLHVRVFGDRRQPSTPAPSSVRHVLPAVSPPPAAHPQVLSARR
jgi:5'-phosphate synthase pdxT subunit